jgi:hypothetical protein
MIRPFFKKKKHATSFFRGPGLGGQLGPHPRRAHAMGPHQQGASGAVSLQGGSHDEMRVQKCVSRPVTREQA